MITEMGDDRDAKDIPVGIENSPFPLTDVDRWVLSQTDEEFHLHDWEELKEIIGKEDSLIHTTVFFESRSCRFIF